MQTMVTSQYVVFFLVNLIFFFKQGYCKVAINDTTSPTHLPPTDDKSSLTIPPVRDIRQEMINAQVIPDILEDSPRSAIRIRYGFDGVNFGDHLNRIQLKKLPSFINWEKKNEHFYTLIMTGLDNPTMKKPNSREFQHWLVTNIPARFSGINEGDTLTEYKVDYDLVASGYYGDGNHRIAYFIFEQPTKEKIIFKEHRIHTRSNCTLRTNFSTKMFAAKHKLKIVGFNWVTLDFKKFEVPEDIDAHAVTPSIFG